MRVRPDPFSLGSLTSRSGIALLIGLIAAASGMAEGAQLSGEVRDPDSNPLQFANVAVLGTAFGAISDIEGRFTVELPAGRYNVQAASVGFHSETRQVTVDAGGARVVFELRPEAKMLSEIEVLGQKSMVDVKAATTVRTVERDQILKMPVDEVQAVIGRQAGVSIYDNEVHIRGGRQDEAVYVIDGVVVKDYITGQSRGGDLSSRSVAEINVLTGGYPAEYGQALSGIINITTREGGTKPKAYMSWTTDHPGGDWDGFRSDYLTLQVEGPLFREDSPGLGGLRIPGQLTYVVDLNGRLSDTYLPGFASLTGDGDARVSSYEDQFLGNTFTYGNPFDNRSENDWQLLTKFTWKPSERDKFNISLNKTLGIDSGFFFRPISRTDPTANTTYPWAWFGRLDHYLTFTEDKTTVSGVWTHLTSQQTLHEFRVSRFFTNQHWDVNGKAWFDYEEPDDQALPEGEDHPFFIQTGDFPRWHDHSVEERSFAWDLTSRQGRYTVKAGADHSFQDIQFIDILFPWVDDPDGLGGVHDLYDVNPQVGALYAQTQFEYEGMVGNIGVRYDYWYPGAEVERAIADTSRAAITPVMRAEFEDDTFGLFGGRLKGRFSPRLSVSHPITEASKIFFNYGRFSQWPTYFYVYSKIGSVSSEDFPLIGNPNLDPEVSSQFEVGGAHEFSDKSVGNLTFFYKDQYDYPAATRVSRLGHNDVFIYRNSDYARTRGIELEFKRRPSPYLGGTVAYTYSVSKGRSSDPNEFILSQEIQGAASQIGLEEGFTFWNRPHKFSFDIDYRIRRGDARPRLFGLKLPDDLSVNLFYEIQSGRAYTPEDRDGNQIGKRYSRNADVEQVMDLRIERGFNFFLGSRFALLLDVRNLLDHRYSRRIDPQTGEQPEDGRGEYSDPPASETSAAFRAALLANPSYENEPRQVRIGASLEWD
jgi:outer membrane receptor protein involved in Fe transport